MAASVDKHTRIPLYARRTIGEKINAAIDFLRQNWRVALRFSIYLLLPIALLHSVGIFTFIRSLTSDTYNSTDIGFLVSSLISFVSICLLYTLIITLFQYYQASTDGDLSMLSFRDVKGLMWTNFKRLLLIMIIILGITILISLLVVAILELPILLLPFFLLIPTLLGSAILFFILMMVPIHYLLENSTVAEAFSRSFSHARESWGRLFALMFAMILVVGIINSVASLPMLVFMIATEILSRSGESSQVLSITFDVILYAFIILETFFGYLSMALVITTLVYHYGSNARENDDLAIANDIDNFANL